MSITTRALPLLVAPLLLLSCTGNATSIGADGSSPGGDVDPLRDGGAAVDGAPHDIGGLGDGVSTLAGSSAAGHVDGSREVALFDDPVNLVVGPDGALYLADFNNGAIRRIAVDGRVTTLATGDDFVRPFGLAFTPSGELYVQTDRNTRGQPSGALWRIDLDDGTPQLVQDDIGRPRGMASLGDGRLVLVDYLAHYVRLYDPETRSATILAGQPESPGYADGLGSAARFATPYDVVVTDDDVLYVADQDNHRIRRITLDGQVTTVAGDGVAESRDGTLEVAQLSSPQALALGEDGVLYVTDTGTARVRKLYLGAGIVTIAGDGNQGFADDEDPYRARFYGLEGLDVSAADGHLYVADGDRGEGEPYHRVRRLVLD